MAIYINIVKQISNIFDLSALYTLSLINVIKKNKGFAIMLYIKKDMKQLLGPLNYHIKAVKIRKT